MNQNEEVELNQEPEPVEKQMTIKQLREQLRMLGMKMAQGEIEDYQLRQWDIDTKVELFGAKVDETYIRNCINQSAEFQKTGCRVSVRSTGKGIDRVYTINLMDESKVRTVSKRVSTKMKGVEVAALIGAILAAEPDLSDMDGSESHVYAIQGAYRMRQAIADSITKITTQD